MRLILHPDSTCRGVKAIAVEAVRGPQGSLVLEYQTSGMPELALPDPDTVTDSMRADALWRHTCFEAFVRAFGGESYCEFNFSPFGQWAAYRFDGYRRNRRDADVARPLIKAGARAGGFMLRAELDLGGLPALSGDWRIGIAAVIEDADGNLAYWALKHPSAKADFHHGDGFALELPAI